MNKDQEFDMLVNADDKTVELLSEVPVLSAAEKERILKMSKEKLMRKKETDVHADNSGTPKTSGNIHEKQMSVVEERRKIRWQYAVPAAACILFVCGILGNFMYKNGRGEIPEDKLTDLPVTSVTELTTAASFTETQTKTSTVTDIVTEITEVSGLPETIKEMITEPAEFLMNDKTASSDGEVTDVPAEKSESRSMMTAEDKERDEKITEQTEKVTEQTENADNAETLITQSDEGPDNVGEEYSFNWPVAGGYGVITSRWMEPVGHKGIDITGTETDDISGKEVTAAADGVVFKVVDKCTHNQAKNDCECGGGYGNYVLIKHNDGEYCTLYAHLGSVTVSEMQKVTAGETIGYVGATGKADQPKLHLEVRKWPFEWSVSNAVDPEQFITAPHY
ncbi:MAG: M23 family metallopeptidase [Oscillospiraceae bacterium]|nr:M23 family metallopeptidase [Oscillospiraceae bacterium]MBR6837008.1 M23 family metallopeptidase [Oscillospiraceae bacterium]